MFILIGILLALVALSVVTALSLYIAMRTAPSYDEVTYFLVNEQGDLIEKELIF